MPNFQVVSFERHASRRWNWCPDYKFAARRAVAPLYAGELGSTVAAMPVAFAEASGRYTLAAMTSLFPDRNDFVGADGKWRGRYIPVFFRLYPFRLLHSAARGGPVLCIDEDSGTLVSADQPGLAFFSSDGSASPALQAVIDHFRKLESIERQTEAAIAALAKAGVIQPWLLKLADGKGGFQDIMGLHRAAEEALNALDDAAFTELRLPLALAIAYGQLYSTNQVSLLAELGNDNAGPSIQDQACAIAAAAMPARTSAVSPSPSTTPSDAPAASKQSKATQRKIASLFDQALRLNRANRLGKAESLCRKILALDDGHAESWQLLGAIALQTGRIDDAAVMSAKAVAHKPEYPAALFNLGIALTGRGDFDGAIESYERVLALRPDHAEAVANLGSALLDKGRAAEAMARLEQALTLKPKLPTALYNLGNALDALGRKGEAVSRYRQALALKPDYVEALSNMGGVLTSQGKLDEAVACYERALSMKPGMAQVLNNLSQAQFSLGRLEAAVRNCLAALRRSGISVPEAVDEGLSLERVMIDLPADCPFTSLQEEYVASFMLYRLSEHGVGDWSDILKPLRRFTWSPEMNFNILLNQTIGHWVRGDLASCRSAYAEADQAFRQIRSKSPGRNFRANLAYHNYLKALLQSASRRPLGPSSPLATIVGDSHGLSYAGLGIEIDGRSYLPKAELVMGAKAWHLGNDARNRHKQRFEWAVNRAAERSVILCSFGEIDCRLDGGILPFYRKRGGNLDDVVQKQTADYVSYVRERLLVRRQTPLFLGVPAPYLEDPHYQLEGATLDDQRLLVEIIRLFNEGLKQAALDRGFGFVDLYALTNDRDGRASGSLHIDSYHLRPEALALALQNR